PVAAGESPRPAALPAPARRERRGALPGDARQCEGDRRRRRRDDVYARRQAVLAGAAEVPREVARRAAPALCRRRGQASPRSDPRACGLPRTASSELRRVVGRRGFLRLAALAVGATACGTAPSRPSTAAEGGVERIAYGPFPSNFAELRVPPGSGPHPVVVVLHGGYWLALFGLHYIVPLCEAITREGFA